MTKKSPENKILAKGSKLCKSRSNLTKVEFDLYYVMANSYTACGWLKFRGVPIFVVFVGGFVSRNLVPTKKQFSVWIMKESAMATNFEPHECVIFAQSTKIGTKEN